MTSHNDPARPGAGDVLQVVCFCVGTQEYALDIMRTKEIINPVPVTPVPHAPPFVEGVIELRGSYLGIIDLRRRLGVDAGPPERDSKYVVVTMQGQHIGLVVDRVSEVRRVVRSEIGPPPALVIGPRARFLSGVAHWEGRLIMLIDLDQVLTLDERAELGSLAAAAAEGPEPIG